MMYDSVVMVLWQFSDGLKHHQVVKRNLQKTSLSVSSFPSQDPKKNLIDSYCLTNSKLKVHQKNVPCYPMGNGVATKKIGELVIFVVGKWEVVLEFMLRAHCLAKGTNWNSCPAGRACPTPRWLCFLVPNKPSFIQNKHNKNRSCPAKKPGERVRPYSSLSSVTAFRWAYCTKLENLKVRYINSLYG